MFSRFCRAIAEWWNQYQEDNRFVEDTLDDLHEKLLVFDTKPDFWTIRTTKEIMVCRGEKFPLYPYGKKEYLCMILLEKKGEMWEFVFVDYSSSGIPVESNYPLAQVDVLVGVMKTKYGIV